MFIVCKILLHGCISRLEKRRIGLLLHLMLHACISCLETKNKKCSHANKLHGCIRGFRIFLKYLKLLFLYWNVGVFWKFLTMVCVFCLNTYIFWKFLTRFYTLIESCRFLIRRFRTLLIGRYFHFSVCVRIRGILCEIPLITPSQHHPKRSSTALRLRSVLTHRRWFVPDKAAPRQTSLFGVLTSLSCRRFVKVQSGAFVCFCGR